MEKQERVAGGEARPGVHLNGASGRSAHKEERKFISHCLQPLTRVIFAPAINYDDFGVG
jgi:hypothetical protein